MMSNPSPTPRHRPAVTSRKKAQKEKLFLIITAAVILLGTVGNILYHVTANGSAKVQETATTPSIRSVTGNTVESDKQAAVTAAIALLNTADISPTGIPAKDRLTALDKSDLTVVDPSLESKIRFPQEVTATDKINTYQTLITIASIVKNTSSLKEIAPFSADAWKNSIADPTTGVVYVPLNIFVGKGAYFSMEMVYIDGTWKLAPYTLVDAVRLSAALQGQLSTSTPTTTTK